MILPAGWTRGRDDQGPYYRKAAGTHSVSVCPEGVYLIQATTIIISTAQLDELSDVLREASYILETTDWFETPRDN